MVRSLLGKRSEPAMPSPVRHRFIDDEPTLVRPLVSITPPPLPTFAESAFDDEPTDVTTLAAPERSETTSISDALAVTVVPPPPSRTIVRWAYVAAAAAVLAVVGAEVAHRLAPAQTSLRAEVAMVAIPPADAADPMPVQAPVATAASPVAIAADPPEDAPKAVVDVPAHAKAGRTMPPSKRAKVASPPVDREERVAAAERAHLTVICDPSCESVTIGGAGFGPSPVIGASVAPGNVAVVLRHAGGRRSVSIAIAPGESRVVRARM